MQTLDQTNIELPPDVGAWVDRAAAVPCVRSVVLFGSRALGRAREHSDWDIAVIHADDESLPCELLSDSYDFAPKHGASTIAEVRWLEQKDHYATLSNEVVAHGVLLRGINHQGHFMPPRQSDPEHAADQFRTMGRSVWRRLTIGITGLAECRLSGFSYADPELAKNAADAVEFIGKLVYLSQGLTFAQTHDLGKISDGLPHEWYEKLVLLNGDLHSDHQAEYGVIASSYAKDGVKAVYDRNRTSIVGGLSILRELVVENMPPLTTVDLRMLANVLSGPARLDFSADVREAEKPLCDKYDAARGEWSRRIKRDLSLAQERDRRDSPDRDGGVTR